jgi:adenylyl cyclase-associated protein
MREAAEFNTFKIIKENKDKDALQVDWGRAWLGVLNEMQGYVKEWHTTGLAWNAKGGDAKAVAGGWMIAGLLCDTF